MKVNQKKNPFKSFFHHSTWARIPNPDLCPRSTTTRSQKTLFCAKIPYTCAKWKHIPVIPEFFFLSKRLSFLYSLSGPEQKKNLPINGSKAFLSQPRFSFPRLANKKKKLFSERIVGDRGGLKKGGHPPPLRWKLHGKPTVICL